MSAPPHPPSAGSARPSRLAAARERLVAGGPGGFLDREALSAALREEAGARTLRGAHGSALLLEELLAWSAVLERAPGPQRRALLARLDGALAALGAAGEAARPDRALLAACDELRAARGAALLAAHPLLAAITHRPARAGRAAALGEPLGSLERALAGWLAGRLAAPAAGAAIGAALGRAARLDSDPGWASLWAAGTALAATLAARGDSPLVRRLLARVRTELAARARGIGAGSGRDALLRALLFQVEHLHPGGAEAGALRRAYRLGRRFEPRRITPGRARGWAAAELEALAGAAPAEARARLRRAADALALAGCGEERRRVLDLAAALGRGPARPVARRAAALATGLAAGASRPAPLPGCGEPWPGPGGPAAGPGGQPCAQVHVAGTVLAVAASEIVAVQPLGAAERAAGRLAAAGPPLLDLAALLGAAPAREPREALVIETAAGPLALACERVEAPLALAREPAPALAGRLAWLGGITRRPGRAPILHLDPRALLAAAGRR